MRGEEVEGREIEREGWLEGCDTATMLSNNPLHPRLCSSHAYRKCLNLLLPVRRIIEKI